MGKGKEVLWLDSSTFLRWLWTFHTGTITFLNGEIFYLDRIRWLKFRHLSFLWNGSIFRRRYVVLIVLASGNEFLKYWGENHWRMNPFPPSWPLFLPFRRKQIHILHFFLYKFPPLACTAPAGWWTSIVSFIVLSTKREKVCKISGKTSSFNTILPLYCGAWRGQWPIHWIIAPNKCPPPPSFPTSNQTKRLNLCSLPKECFMLLCCCIAIFRGSLVSYFLTNLFCEKSSVKKEKSVANWFNNYVYNMIWHHIRLFLTACVVLRLG